MGVNPRARTIHPHQQESTKTQWMGVNLRGISVQWTGVNLRAETKCSHPHDPMEI